MNFYLSFPTESSFSFSFCLIMTSKTTLKFIKNRLFAFKVLGFFSLTIVNDKSVTKFFDVLYFLFALLLGFFFAYLAVVNREVLANSKSKIAEYGNFIVLIVSIVVSMSAMCMSFIFRHKIWLMILTLAELEDEVEINFLINNSLLKFYVLVSGT